jgi:formate dehydrogenase major subunit
VILSPEKTLADDVATLKITVSDNSDNCVKQIITSVINKNLTAQKFIDARVNGFAAFQAALAGMATDAQSDQIAEWYAGAKKAVIVIDGNVVKPAGAQLLADLALITGKIGVPRSGLVLVTPGSNAYGLLASGGEGSIAERRYQGSLYLGRGSGGIGNPEGG